MKEIQHLILSNFWKLCKLFQKSSKRKVTALKEGVSKIWLQFSIDDFSIKNFFSEEESQKMVRKKKYHYIFQIGMLFQYFIVEHMYKALANLKIFILTPCLPEEEKPYFSKVTQHEKANCLKY